LPRLTWTNGWDRGKENSMNKVRSTRMAMIASIGFLALAMLIGASSALAKTRTKTFSRCVSVAVPSLAGPAGNTAPSPDASLASPVTAPRFKRRPQRGVVTAVNSVGVRISHSDVGDLALFLVSPGGRAVALSTFRDASSNNSGDGY